MNLKKSFKFFLKSISHAQHTIFISTECPFHTLLLTGCDIFKYTSLPILFFMATKVNWSTKV